MQGLAAQPVQPAALAFAEDTPLFGKASPGMDAARKREPPIRAGRVFRILLGGTTVGGLALLHSADDAVWIHVLSIDPAFRNRGIGRRARLGRIPASRGTVLPAGAAAGHGQGHASLSAGRIRTLRNQEGRREARSDADPVAQGQPRGCSSPLTGSLRISAR